MFTQGVNLQSSFMIEGVSFTGPKAWPVFGRAKAQNVPVGAGLVCNTMFTGREHQGVSARWDTAEAAFRLSAKGRFSDTSGIRCSSVRWNRHARVPEQAILRCPMDAIFVASKETCFHQF